MLFWLEGRTLKGPGEVVFVPRGKEHTFHVVGSQPARFVTMMTPEGFEGFFPAVARGGYRTEDMPAAAAIAADYSLEFTGPTLKS